MLTPMQQVEVLSHADGVHEALDLTIELLISYNAEGDDVPAREACARLIEASKLISQAQMAMSASRKHI